MNNKILTIILIFFFCGALSQPAKNQNTEPQYPNGKEAMLIFIQENQKIPFQKECKFNVECNVSKEGKITFNKLFQKAVRWLIHRVANDIKDIIKTCPHGRLP